MKKIIATLGLIGGLVAGGLLVAEQADQSSSQDKKSQVNEAFKQGMDYSLLEQEQANGGNKVEVIEFFSYACSHCQSFEPFVTNWEKRKGEHVKLTLIPVSFNPSWEAMAKAYYATEAMGVTGKTHAAIFNAIHKDKKSATNIEQITDIVASLGIDRAKFLENINSFNVETSMRRGQQLAAKYRITGVPTVAVNGRYISSGTMAGGYPRLIKIIDYLVEQESHRLKNSKKEISKKKEPDKK